MKKVLGYMFFGLCLYFMFIFNVFADGINFELKTLEPTKEVIKGNYVDVKLALNSSVVNTIDYCIFSIEASNTLEFREMQTLNSWSVNTNSSLENVVEVNVKNNQTSLSETSNVLNIKYVVNDNGTVKINSSLCYDAVGSLVNTTINEKPLEIKVVDSTKAILKSLKINNQELNPYFSSSVTSYNVNNFTANKLSLEYEINDLNYQDQVVVMANDKIVSDINNIPYEVTEGNKAMLITVTVANANTYNIFVSKNVDLNFNNTLSSITVNGEELQLVSGKYDYVYIVADNVNSVEVSAMLADSENFQFGSLSNAPASFDMNGKVTAVMNVVPKNNQVGIPATTYTVTIVNESNSSSVNTPNVNNNPTTGDTTMYVMAIILFASLVGSIVLYQKNINGYK